MREAKHKLRTMITRAGLDADDYVDKLVAARVYAELLPGMTTAEVNATGIVMGDAIRLVKSINKM